MRISPLKDKQYWFYWHDEKNKTNLSFDEAYKWMGDFDNEHVIAKHSARIAQCFTSSEATIRVPREKTEIIDDIERNGYIFTDGVGTFSSRLRDEICVKMGYRRKFSVMQIRYGGCKGTVSVNPDLDYTEKQMILRKSMYKFISTHDVLELCKVSAPRPIHLNRQVIALLESRHIPHSTFLLLQNQHLLSLVESLLYLPSTYELLHERLPPHLQLRDLILTAQIDLIHEPFFRQLITTMCKHEIKRIQDKTRIQISKNSGRNMFGIVDETATLKSGQVFCQYTILNTEQLDDLTRSNNIRSYYQEDIKKVVVGKIVVTKNPCHHPGDLRTFEAIDVPKLRHLVDCIVFPQLGDRPHPNEISGSDLDVNLTLPKFVSSPPISSFPLISSWWSDEMACKFYKLFLNLTAQCSRTHVLSDSSQRMDLAHLNEYLTLGLLSIAAENEFGNVTWHGYFDSTFAVKPFSDGARQALTVVSRLIGNNQFDDLSGLVTQQAINEIKKNYENLTSEQKQKISVDESEIVFTYPYLIGMIMDEQKNSRLVEITMIFHILKDRNSYQEEMLHAKGDSITNWTATMKKMRDNIVVCNYKFLRDMSKNANDDSWIITGLNHWLPSEYEQQ
ncbi:unnamed protein product [Rotaria sp. Silwood1]|nr:unnamed protein product [Rotaria sp. Silwood1]